MTTQALFELNGRVAIVTGGSVGLGRQMAHGLAEMGANIVLCARKRERCLQTAQELRALGTEVLALPCDVKDAASIEQVIDATMRHFGRIDILVNDAGTSWGALVEDMPLEQWHKVIETNLTGTFLFCQAVAKTMIGQRRGKIINIASVAGLRGWPPELSAIGYSASKGGIIAFTRDLAWKWGVHGIQVNAIAPGWFPTHMSQKVLERHQEKILPSIPLGHFGGPDDLKGAAVFLASDAANFITGHILVVDGG